MKIPGPTIPDEQYKPSVPDPLPFMLLAIVIGFIVAAVLIKLKNG
jgi:multisubunit Na+/H+ antiporter MnhC subunit